MGDHHISYDYSGTLVQRRPDGTQDVFGMGDGQGCFADGSMTWLEGEGLVGPVDEVFHMVGHCAEDAPFWAFLPAEWEEPAGTWEFPNHHEIVGGRFGFGAGRDAVSVPLDFTITLLEAVGELTEPPDDAPEDFLRHFTVTAEVDCEDAPELDCVGIWSIDLEARVVADDVYSLNH